MAEQDEKKTQSGAVQTTGHAWDGDIQEFNNPLPDWWLWSFYATAVFALIYWVLYPAWPVGDSYTKGVETVTIEVNGKPVTSHWNTRARLEHELQTGEESLRQKAYLAKVAKADYAAILSDPDMLAFTASMAKGIFGDNCAACHGTGGVGNPGRYPALVDDDWLWGGTVEDIEATIRDGRHGFMPAFRETFDASQTADVAEYVLSLSGNPVDKMAAERGRGLFQGQGGGCYYCHTKQATGRHSLGAANLTDAIWTVADVQSAPDLNAKRSLIRDIITHGVSRSMPAWKDRLSPTQIKLLTVYVHELGGGS